MYHIYMVTRETKMLILMESSMYYRSLIIEENQETDNSSKYSHFKPEQIIDYNCKRYGSTLNGRKEVVKEILHSSSKIPIPIIPHLGIYIFPTASNKNKNCVWLAYHHIKDYKEHNDKTMVSFFDGTGMEINSSTSVFDRQYKRASQVIVHFNRSLLFGKGPKLW
ncbi:competence protein ComK [Oceanobacillus salinisoli]|uniref:competence protein ComK n=1 Tax=Oceanobacillus salinisoli TaxID=2678611 RepID=UPI0012E1E63A|nr:competence protein ComK [Oceanobacillus salinisoli]